MGQLVDIEEAKTAKATRAFLELCPSVVSNVEKSLRHVEIALGTNGELSKKTVRAVLRNFLLTSATLSCYYADTFKDTFEETEMQDILHTLRDWQQGGWKQC